MKLFIKKSLLFSKKITVACFCTVFTVSTLTAQIVPVVAPAPLPTHPNYDGVYSYPRQEKEIFYHGDKLDKNPYHKVSPHTLSIKTNLLWGAATLTPNLGLEVGLGAKTSLELMAGYNPWNLDGSKSNNKKRVHTIAKPEFRYWLCERFNGYFFGVHAFYANYNVSGYDVPSLFEKSYRYEGTAWGGGISFGYNWIWNRRWGMEFNIGIGAAYLNYDQYECALCGNLVSQNDKVYFGPTGAGIKLVFMIK